MGHALDTANAPLWVTITFFVFCFFLFLAMIGFIAFRWKDGLWGAILLSFNLAFATLIAVNYFEPLGKMLAGAAPVGLFYWDCLIFIILVLLCFAIFNMITNRISRVIVSFPKVLEYIVLPLFLIGVWAFQMSTLWMFVMQIGPTAPKPFAGAIDFEQNRKGNEVYMISASELASTYSLSCLSGPNPFPDAGEFEGKHYKRRCALLDELWKNGNSRFSGSVGFLD